MKKLEILYLTPRFPYPLIGGDRIKSFMMLAHLSSNHNVTLVTFYQGNSLPKSYKKAIEEMGIELRIVPLNPVIGGLRCMTRLFGKRPLEILYYYQPEFQAEVNRVIEEKDIDLSISFFMRTAEYVKNAEFAKILTAEDCRTLYQRRSYEKSERLIQKYVRYWEWKKLSKYEPEMIGNFDITTVVSDRDMVEMKSLNPNAELRLLTNGTNINEFHPPSDNSKRKDVLFAGKLDLWANQMMIQSIVKEIMPQIREKFPAVKLNIVGAKPPQSILSLRCDWINVHPDVPEMAPYLRNAKIFIHPHKGASGIQNKLLEALACGCPVVTTTTGNQGIKGVNNEEMIIGENPAELAELAIELLSDNELYEKISLKGRELILRKHTWESINKRLDEILDELFPGQ